MAKSSSGVDFWEVWYAKMCIRDRMYCEFIDISEYGENYITFTEYHDYIEPIYMDADLSKQDFVALLKETIHQMVEPVVQRAIHNIPLPDKLAIAFSDEEPVELLDRIAKIDLSLIHIYQIQRRYILTQFIMKER